jgi:5-methylcytosine-specific restriction endonuclease McrA
MRPLVCEYPGCHEYRWLHRHHIKFRSRGGSDREANIAVLCVYHHEWVHRNPRKAHELGLALHAWEPEYEACPDCDGPIIGEICRRCQRWAPRY